jgi:hypothetical protein
MVRDSTRAGAVINRVRSLIGKADFVRERVDVNERSQPALNCCGTMLSGAVFRSN